MPERPLNEQWEGDGTVSRPEGPPAGHALPGGPESADPVLVTGPAVAPDLPLAAGALPADVDPDTARQEIVRTRARMSETIDQIEEQLLRRKERLQEQLDVRGQLRERLAPAREVVEQRPLLLFGGVFAAALALGYLTGESASDDDVEVEVRGEGDVRGPSWRSRSRTWERRSRELLRRNHELEDELRALRARLDDHLGEEETGWLGSAVAGAVGTWFAGRPAREQPIVELDEHDLPGEYHPSASYDQFAQTQRTRAPEDPLQP